MSPPSLATAIPLGGQLQWHAISRSELGQRLGHGEILSTQEIAGQSLYHYRHQGSEHLTVTLDDEHCLDVCLAAADHSASERRRR